MASTSSHEKRSKVLAADNTAQLKIDLTPPPNGLKKFLVRDLLRPPYNSPLCESEIYCKENQIHSFTFVIFTPDRPGRYRITIDADKFNGRVQFGLGSGQGQVLISTELPINAEINLWRDCTLKIGRGTSINQAKIIADYSDIVIGEDNLWSDAIVVQSNDQHGILDVETMTLRRNERTRITTGNHVWIGRRALLLPDVAIEDGAIVAAGAVVTTSVDPMCVAGGNPARVIARNTSWTRSPTGPTRAESAFLDELKARLSQRGC